MTDDAMREKVRKYKEKHGRPVSVAEGAGKTNFNRTTWDDEIVAAFASRVQAEGNDWHKIAEERSAEIIRLNAQLDSARAQGMREAAEIARACMLKINGTKVGDDFSVREAIAQAIEQQSI